MQCNVCLVRASIGTQRYSVMLHRRQLTGVVEELSQDQKAGSHIPGSLNILRMVAGHFITSHLLFLSFWSRLCSISRSLHLFSCLDLRSSMHCHSCRLLVPCAWLTCNATCKLSQLQNTQLLSAIRMSANSSRGRPWLPNPATHYECRFEVSRGLE